MKYAGEERQSGMPMNIVLVYPEIPQNTGNIARTCAATGSTLHLVEPLGYSLDDRYLRRAGLDYWPLARVQVHPTLEAAKEALAGVPWFLTSAHAQHGYTEVQFPEEVALVFGRESRGLPQEMLEEQPQRCIRIPMLGETRSLNLSNSAAIILYEALRQNGFEGMKLSGQLHRHVWGQAAVSVHDPA
jgi:tRNA (cytidine/uridine-2'-O-)-methyltransferase